MRERYRKILFEAFEKIHADFSFLVQCYREVLSDLGEERLLKWLDAAVDGQNLPNEEAPPRIEQLYSILFQLLNMVEENVASQARRKREIELGAKFESGLWSEKFSLLQQSGVDPRQIANALCEIEVEPVLTAHPTEAKRATVLEQHRDLYLLLVQLENNIWTPKEREAMREQIKVAIERLWRTGEIYLEKPDVQSERRNVIYYLRHALPTAVHRHDERIREAWIEQGWDINLLSHPSRLPKLSFGTWVGGDRDGHPLVTEVVTLETLHELRAEALTMLREKLTTLIRRLSLSSYLQTVNPDFAELLEQRLRALEAKGEEVRRRNPGEPWRQFVGTILLRLPSPNIDLEKPPATSSKLPPYRHANELLSDLELLRDSLLKIGAHRIAHADVDPLIRTVQVFGFHLAALDIRQNALFHEKAVEQLIRAAGYHDWKFSEWSEEKRISFLNQELQTTRPLSLPQVSLGPEADAVRKVYRVLANWVEEHGCDALGALIVSMTRSLSDLLVVNILAREAGLLQQDGEGNWVCPLPIVPLFETNDDLLKSPEILSGFLEHPMTRNALKLRAKKYGGRFVQQVMIGYSDSNKDAGLFSAQWALHNAQRKMTQAAAKFGVELCFFHGRGGTISRGAGPTHRFMEALPEGTISGRIRLTEQGETIAQKYSNPLTATYNLELLSAGVAWRTFRDKWIVQDSRNDSQTDELTALLDELAAHSMTAYRALLESEGFMTFYCEATPIDALEAARIGSRPTRRSGLNSLADLRAIPWVFSWTQARFYLPGWYGLGSAWEALTKKRKNAFEIASEGLRKSPFLKYVLTNAETNLASASREIMQEYAALVRNTAVREKFLQIILDEYDKTSTALNQLFGGNLEERRPRMTKTIALRRAGLTVLHRRQIVLLKKWREARLAEDEKAAAEMLPYVLLSINAIASGLRTTG